MIQPPKFLISAIILCLFQFYVNSTFKIYSISVNINCYYCLPFFCIHFIPESSAFIVLPVVLIQAV